MTTAPTELKPCPFCSSEAIRCSSEFFPSMYWVLCRACHACPGERPTMAEAEALWDTRAPAALEPQAVDDAMVERAARALEAKLHLIHDHHRYKLVWEVAQSHLGPYDGPTYEEELMALTAALQAAKEPSHD